ncbi:helix-turn-helix transcriptional regulator [Rhodospirillaceae bacterium KN72]|uniref:Helix-turn-helix transcriptional regulator n=1 Tax=Pacificispira spongiicola TaxID=2729598 RepID=A0A7Y0HFQ8_9PROT|nr:AraC family transcriptional regulator [Pacificispira spongiicola]NMM44858.1 helix-turn-helix transcriptional regulator [Pacificispira spongiicola]
MNAGPASLSLRSYRGAVQAHSHDYHQFVLPLHGRLEMESRGYGGYVDARTAAFVPAGDIHVFEGRGVETRCVVLDIPQRRLGALDMKAEDGPSPFFQVDRALHHLLSFVDTRGTGDIALPGLILSTALDALAPNAAAQPSRLRAALSFMVARYDQPLTVADIAAAAATSPSRLFALFREWTGISPLAYLTRLRLDRAKLALRHGSVPIAQIALTHGFGDQTAFTRAFRREVGETPGAYRRRCRLDGLGR